MATRPRKPIGRRGPGRGRKTFWLFVAVAASVCAGGLVLTWTRIAVVDRSYAIAAARAENVRLHHELAGLRIEAATLQSTASVARAASQVLKMVRPNPDQIVVLEPGRPPPSVKGVVTAAAWAPAPAAAQVPSHLPAPVPLAVNGP